MSRRCSPSKEKSEAVSEKLSSKVIEDLKVVQRNVTVLQQDYQTLKEQVAFLESRLQVTSSTPNKSYQSTDQNLDNYSSSSILFSDQEEEKVRSSDYGYELSRESDISESVESDRINSDPKPLYREDKRTQQTPAISTQPAISVTKAQLMLKSQPYLLRIKAGSSSVKNFAARLNAEIFTAKERVERNVNGIGKPKLNEAKTSAIRDAVFATYAIELSKQGEIWKECTTAIDSMNRKLKPQ